MTNRRMFLKQSMMLGGTGLAVGLDPLSGSEIGKRVASQPDFADEQSVDKAVKNEFERGLFPGAVVAAGGLKGFHFLKAYGYARIKPGLMPMFENTLFDLESVTKVVATGTALSICIDRGLIDIDAPVRKYLPELTGAGTGDILIRHLVTHTSGYNWGRVCGENKNCNFFATLLDQSIDHPVGHRYVYSNRNAILSGLLVESVVGGTLGGFCNYQIFNLLGMHDTHFSPVPHGYTIAASRSDMPHVAANTDVRKAGRPIGTAGLFSTAHDLSLFCRTWLGQGMLNNVKLFSVNTWKLAVSNLSPLNTPPLGIFWKKNTIDLDRPTLMSEKAFGHGGYTGQSIWIDPEQDIYTIVLTNRNHPQLEKSSTERGKEQYHARSRIADAVIRMFR